MRPLALGSLVLAVLALGAGLLLWQSHPLVSMSNDHQGRSILPPAQPGDRVLEGGVKIGNNGALPYTYTVKVADPAAGIRLRIERYPAGPVLYAGPEPSAPVVLGRLQPGQQEALKITISSDRDLASPTFVWQARGETVTWDPGRLALPLVGLFAALDAALLAAWLRERRRRRSELR